MKKPYITKHILVPEHIKLSDEEIKKVLEQYNISKKQLPKILKNDAAIKHLNPKVGDVIKIIRNSEAQGKIEFFRVVVNG